MVLKSAIQNNFGNIADAHKNYRENVITVNTFITGVLASNLPVLNESPADWADYSVAYTAAKADALDWVNNVMARLLSVPDQVRNYNDIIVQILQDAQAQATALTQQPDSQITLKILVNDLESLSKQLNLIVVFVAGSVSSVQNFKSKLPEMATKLQSIADKATKDANIDQTKIDKLKKDIDKLNADIKSLTAAIVGLAIADGIALTLGIVATIAAWPVGAVTWLVLGPAIAVATTYIALDAKQIQADKKTIDDDKAAIKGIEADVAALHVLAQAYSQMSEQAEKMEENVQLILNEWMALEADVNAAIVKIRSALADTNVKNYDAVLNDVNGAIAAWNEGYAQAGALHIDLEVNNTVLTVGMSSEDVKSAVENGSAMPVIEFYNRLTA